MVEATLAPHGAVVAAPIPTRLDDTAGPEASTVQYLASGERVAVLMNAAWTLGAGLFVLLAIVWLLGVLPGAVRLF